MALYFFHLHECGTIIPDVDGNEMADAEAARTFAVSAARDIMSNEIKAGRLCLGCLIVIEDAAGGEVARVAFREAVNVTGV